MDNTEVETEIVAEIEIGGMIICIEIEIETEEGMYLGQGSKTEITVEVENEVVREEVRVRLRV